MLQTTLKNNSGVARFYGFLPPHGRQLAAGAEITVPLGALQNGADVASRRRAAALQAALDAGHISIKESAPVVVYDTTLETSRVVALDNNTYGTVSPSDLITGGLALPSLADRSSTGASGGSGGTVAALTNSGGTIASWAILSGAVAGLTINSSTGVVSWINSVAAATYTLVIRGTNARGSDTATLTLTLT